MNEPSTLYTEQQIRLARYAKALSHPVRVYIMEYLVKNSSKCFYSGTISDDLPIARSTLSQHLSELKEAGLIQGEISAPYIRYCLDHDHWEEAKQLFAELLQ
jgi:DNA-binding transcriptional ArsR family regulator